MRLTGQNRRKKARDSAIANARKQANAKVEKAREEFKARVSEIKKSKTSKAQKEYRVKQARARKTRKEQRARETRENKISKYRESYLSWRHREEFKQSLKRQVISEGIEKYIYVVRIEKEGKETEWRSVANPSEMNLEQIYRRMKEETERSVKPGSWALDSPFQDDDSNVIFFRRGFRVGEWTFTVEKLQIAELTALG